MEKCQGPLAARWGLGVIALLPGQVQLGTAERHLRHGIKDLQEKLNKRVMSYQASWGKAAWCWHCSSSMALRKDQQHLFAQDVGNWHKYSLGSIF